LAFSALYTYRRKITLEQMNNIFCSGFTIISCTVYLIFYTPNIEISLRVPLIMRPQVVLDPNQVATFFGLGMFIFFSNYFESRSKILLLINLVIAANSPTAVWLPFLEVV
jgi:hypothetical protein